MMEAKDRNGAHCYEIRQILQEIDPLFDVEFYYPDETYEISFNSGHFQSIGYNDIDRNFFDNLREIYWLNAHGKILEDIDATNEKLEASQDRAESSFSGEIARQLHGAAVDRKVYGGVAL